MATAKTRQARDNVKVVRASFPALNTAEEQPNQMGNVVQLPPRVLVGKSNIQGTLDNQRQFKDIVQVEEVFSQLSGSVDTAKSLTITTTLTNSADVLLLHGLQISWWVDGTDDANLWPPGTSPFGDYFDGSTAVKTSHNYEVNASLTQYARSDTDDGTMVFINRFSNNSGSTVTVYAQARILYISNQLVAV